MSALSLAASLFTFLAFAGSTDLKEKDVWSYRTRPGEEKSTVTILKLEEMNGMTVAHIRVDGLKFKNPHVASGLAETLPHMPFDAKVLRKSLRKKLRTAKELPDFQEGYQEWRRANAGAFTISVKEAITGAERALRNPPSN